MQNTQPTSPEQADAAELPVVDQGTQDTTAATDIPEDVAPETTVDEPIAPVEAPVAETPAPAPEPIPEPIPVPEVQPTPVAQPVAAQEAATDEQAYLNKMRLEGSDVQKRILAAVETFYGQMTPRAPLKPTDVANFQHELLQHLLWLIEKDYADFRAAWNLLLVYFSVYHRDDNRPDNYSPLSEYSTTRYMFAWTKGEEKAQAYTNFITLLRATRNRDTRKHDIKMIDLAKVAPGVISSKALNNLQQFYAA